MFESTIGVYVKHLTNLRAILEKAKAFQAERKITDEAMLGARLALDQFPLASQVRIACNSARDAGSTLCGLPNLSYEDNEKTLADLQARIDKVLAHLATLSPAMVKDDLDTRLVPMYWMPGKGIPARFFVERYTHDNFYFHYVTAYSILRHYGLSIGKMDFMGGVELKDLA